MAINANKTLYLHRFIMNAPNHMQVDHIKTKETLNNKKCNLRLATNAQNSQNKSGAYRNNKSSGLRGISWDKNRNKWLVKCQVNGQYKNFGRFESLKEAEDVAKNMRKQLMPYATDIS
jgi:hypothetical protein